MKKIIAISICSILLPFFALAQGEEKKSFDYYYAVWCSHCQKVNKFFDENGIYEKYNVNKLNFDDSENKIKLKDLFQGKGYGSQIGIPAILIDDKLLAGENVIMDYFQKDSDKKAIAAEEKKNNEKFPMSALIGAALADAINPCAFAVLVLLLATVMNAKGKKQALWSGLLFSLAIFISYFLMGLGLYKVITLFNLPKYISVAIGVLAIIIGLANLKDTFWYGKYFVMEVPFKWRPKMQSIIKHVASPMGAFFTGFLVSLFLLPCTSGPYVLILGLLAERVELARTVSLLILYNFIFIIPMLLITIGMHYGVRLGKLDELRQKNIKALHLIVGSVMLFIGFYLLYQWL